MKHGEAKHLKQLGSANTKYPTHPDEAILEKIKWEGGDSTVITLHCPEYTCACPRTGQPDFATIIIQYVPNDYIVESKALKLYLFSFRNYGHFHEVGIERICSDINKFIEPKWIRVIGDFNKRGGISIVPITEFGDKSYSKNCYFPSISYGS